VCAYVWLVTATCAAVISLLRRFLVILECCTSVSARHAASMPAHIVYTTECRAVGDVIRHTSRGLTSVVTKFWDRVRWFVTSFATGCDAA
jgi:hypothetical protein